MVTVSFVEDAPLVGYVSLEEVALVELVIGNGVVSVEAVAVNVVLV